MSYVLIVGAKSDIAKAIAREYAKHGYDLYLAARNSAELADFANDINVRTQRKVKLVELDILAYQSHQAVYDSLEEKPLGVITAVGYLGEQKKAQVNFDEAQRILDTNYTGVVSFLNIVANDFEQRKSGFIVGISSVAGERGRKSNYLYGSAKAALTAYLSGLRNRLHQAHVQVLTVKPGFVATKMTEGMDLPKKLTATPEEVASDIFSAQQKGKNSIYTKWIWKYIMLVIKLIPEWKFKGMSI
ncbi:MULTISPECIES: SDR family oxidoreductase [unclassified Pseudoalteromonas]|mgnify:CR=1 FL=1|uniref:SDR family oxidoreductase n=1 Tax=unclassified Pseudoalteromonas TaxID=194690 RepID=UPI001EEFD2BD|nr:SDR family oxidoreductase [Pseudoalteromonas sp. L21]MCF7518712.1 SDR family oxidoreductase [Pseudoalteromonas sp. L21]UJX26414.1 SDR family oxidoreductase [Pseudoalteromonas sp. CF6-2]